jgi:inhibitor of KinA sporulation pathway (predicted exonuclease)
MNYVIYDLEFTNNHYHKRFKNEIIEIGAVYIDDLNTLGKIKYFQQLVNPKLTICKNIQKLTGITNTMVKEAYRFPNMILPFKHWLGKEDFTFVTWGPTDEKVFRLNCSMHHLHTSWIKKHINLQDIVRDINNLDRDISLHDALEMYNVPVHHEHHRALKDAFNTMLILIEVSKQINLSRYKLRKPKKKTKALVHNILLKRVKDRYILSPLGKQKIIKALKSEVNRKKRVVTWGEFINSSSFKLLMERYTVEISVIDILFNIFDELCEEVITNYPQCLERQHHLKNF